MGKFRAKSPGAALWGQAGFSKGEEMLEIVSAAQMTGLYGNTNWHGSAGPRHREH